MPSKYSYEFGYNPYVSTSIIPTKQYIPQLQASVISRSRLIDKVINGLSGKLTLVSAPAGFGKTTLLSDSTQQLTTPLSWISLDKDDNDRTRFLAYFISGLRKISEGFGLNILDALQSNQPPSIDILLSGLINEIVEIQTPFVIILDDFHEITNPEIHEILTFIIENQPSEMHLVISSRSDPPWPLARWRVRQEMTEIRSQDLRFSVDETKTFLNDVMELNLSEEAVSKLETRTEGWIAGLLLAAISLQGREDVATFIKTFEGSHRFIFDYLVEEVLNQLSSEKKDFLIKTSILDKVCAPLCNAVLMIKNSQAILHKLDSMNLFIIPLDDTRYWYRYHNLFSDLLASQQVELETSQIAELHSRASIWYENNGHLLDAINHAFKGGSIEKVAQLIEANVLGIIDRGELGGLIKLLNQLPEKSFIDYPWLRIARTWALTQMGSFEEARSYLTSTENELQGKPTEQARHINGHIAAVKCYIELLSLGDFAQGITLAQNALALLPASDLRTRGMVYVILGTMQRTNQHPSEALETLQSALEIYQTRNQPYVMIDILAQMARAYREQGLLQKTVQVCQEGLETAHQNSTGRFGQFPNIAYTMGILGRIYYEWNQLDKTVEIGLQGLAISERWGQANTLLGMYLLLARVFRFLGRHQDALDAIQAAKLVGSRFSETHVFVIQTHEMFIRLAIGDLDSVENWVKVDSKNFEIHQDERLWELAPLIVALNCSDRIDSLDELLAALERLSNVSIESKIQRRSIKVDIQKSVIFHLQKKYDQSLTSIGKALSNGKKEGYVRSFIDHGPPMENILKRAIARGVEVNYANELLAILLADPPETKSQPIIQGVSYGIEPLTHRETEVLRLLSTPLSVPEIADDLVVTVGTLRTHIKRIYNKLNSHSRFEAVSKAKELSLLG